MSNRSERLAKAATFSSGQAEGEGGAMVNQFILINYQFGNECLDLIDGMLSKVGMVSVVESVEVSRNVL